jgi:hypothetical protein
MCVYETTLLFFLQHNAGGIQIVYRGVSIDGH